MSLPLNQAFHKQINCVVNGENTEIVFEKFSNKWFLLITQYGTMPCLYQVEHDVNPGDQLLAFGNAVLNDPVHHKSAPITIKLIFGTDKEDHRAALQYVIDKTMLKKFPDVLLASVTLKQTNQKSLQQLTDVINNMIDF